MHSRVIIACQVMQAELDMLRAGDPSVEVRYLNQQLHRTPQKMPQIIQDEVDKVSGYAEEIVLCYGLCSNGTAGVRAREQRLIIPRAHDCIALLMGSAQTYRRYFSERPGTYYLTRGWVAERKDPLSIVDDEYTPRIGRETAIWVMQAELRHYTHITLIRAGEIGMESVRERARENAVFFEKEYDEIEGSLDYFERMIHGFYDLEDFMIISPGQEITQDMFLCGETAC